MIEHKGLNDKEVEESRKKYGSNAIPDSEPTTMWKEFLEEQFPFLVFFF